MREFYQNFSLIFSGSQNIFLKSVCSWAFLCISCTRRNVSESRCIELWLTKRIDGNQGWHLLDEFASAMSNSLLLPGICGLLLNPIRSNMFTVVHRIDANRLFDAFHTIGISKLLSCEGRILRSQNIFTIHKITVSITMLEVFYSATY